MYTGPCWLYWARLSDLGFFPYFKISFSVVVLRSLPGEPVVKGLPSWLSSKESTCSAGAAEDTGSIPGLGRSSGGGHGNTFQYSCLENPTDRGAWWATVHRVTKSWRQLKRLSIHTRTLASSLYHTSNAQGVGSIPGQGTKIPHAVQHGQKINE